MFTAKARYGLKAMIYLAGQSARTINLTEIARNERIPEKFLAGILRELRNDGLLYIKQGAKGGYFLVSSPADISIGRILRALDGSLAPMECASETAYRPCDECLNPATCTARNLMLALRDATASVLDQTTLADVAGLRPLAEPSLVAKRKSKAQGASPPSRTTAARIETTVS
jgi:Rrf2 family protein